MLAMLVNMHDAKTRLSELVAAAERGEDIVIARNSSPAVRLVAIATEYAPVRLGVLAGEIEIGRTSTRRCPSSTTTRGERRSRRHAHRAVGAGRSGAADDRG